MIKASIFLLFLSIVLADKLCDKFDPTHISKYLIQNKLGFIEKSNAGNFLFRMGMPLNPKDNVC